MHAIMNMIVFKGRPPRAAIASPSQAKLADCRHALWQGPLEHPVVVVVLGRLGQPPHPRQAPLEIRVRLGFGRFRNRSTDYISESVIKWMSGDTKGQCDQALSSPAR